MDEAGRPRRGRQRESSPACRVVLTAQVHLFATLEEAAHVKLELGAAAAAGVDVSGFHWLTAEEARARYGNKTLAAVLIPGNNIYPLKFVTEVFLAAEANQSEGTQLSLYTHCCVDSISPAYEEDKTGYRWTLKTSRGVIHTFVAASFCVADGIATRSCTRQTPTPLTSCRP